MPTKPDKIIEELKERDTNSIIGEMRQHNKVHENVRNVKTRDKRIRFYNSIWIDKRDVLKALKKLEQEKDKEMIRLKDNIKGFSGIYSVCCGERIELKEEIKELKKYTNQCNLDEFRTKQIKELKTKLKDKDDE